MAFPVVESTALTETGSSTSHAVTLPSNIAAGDLLIIHSGFENITVTTPTGWTEVLDQAHTEFGGREATAFSMYRIADGTEGATVTITTSAASYAAHIAYRVSGADDSTAPERTVTTGAASDVDAGTTNYNPPSLTPSWGSEETLWLVALYRGGGGADTIASLPTNFSNGLIIQQASTHNARRTTVGCQATIQAASVDPDTLGVTGPSTDAPFVLATWAIRTVAESGETFNVSSTVTATADATGSAFQNSFAASTVTATATAEEVPFALRQDVVFDISDLSTLFQDDAGTTAVTTDGDPVGRVEDLSGNGHHWTNTGVDRPIYRTDGEHHWLEVDGTGTNNQNLQTNTVSVSSAAMLFAGFQSDVPETAFITYLRWEGDGVDDRRFALASNNANAGRVRVDTDSDVNEVAGNEGAVDVPAVYGWGVQSGDVIYQRRGQIQDGDEVEAIGSTLTGTIADTGFIRYGFTTTDTIRCYGAVLHDGDLQEAEEEEIKTFLAWNTGLPVEVKGSVAHHDFTSPFTFAADKGDVAGEREVTILAPTVASGYAQWLDDVEAYRTFGDDKTEIRPSSEAPFATDYFRCNIPEGTSSPSDLGSNNSGSQWLANFFSSNRAWLRYQVRFGAGFDWVLGGKLPGLLGGDAPTGSGVTTAGFTTRMMWRANGEGELYGYFYNKDSSAGESLGRGLFDFTADTWHTIEQEVKLNTVDEATGTVYDDGYTRIWFDGTPVFQVSRMVFRDTNAVKINGIISSIFFGGTGVEWRSTQDEDVDVGDFQVWVSDEDIAGTITARANSESSLFTTIGLSASVTTTADATGSAFQNSFASSTVTATADATGSITQTAFPNSTVTALAVTEGDATVENNIAVSATVTAVSTALTRIVPVADEIIYWAEDVTEADAFPADTVAYVKTDGPNPTRFRYNGEWRDTISFIRDGAFYTLVEIIEVSSDITSTVTAKAVTESAATTRTHVSASATAIAVASGDNTVDNNIPVSASVTAIANTEASAFENSFASSTVTAIAAANASAFENSFASSTVTAIADAIASAFQNSFAASTVTSIATATGSASETSFISGTVTAVALASGSADLNNTNFVSATVTALATSEGDNAVDNIIPVSGSSTAVALAEGDNAVDNIIPVSGSSTAVALAEGDNTVVSPGGQIFEVESTVTARATVTSILTKLRMGGDTRERSMVLSPQSRELWVA